MTLASSMRSAVEAFDSRLPTRRGITVLIYHRVGGGSSSGVDIEPSVFEAQLDHLVQHHRVLTLDDAVSALGSGSDAHGVVLTFDDGTADFVEHAVPLLQRFAVPATLYVATSFVDSSTTFPWGAAPVSWSGLADAVSTGLVTIGSHTHTHRLLRDASEREVIDEVRRSSDLITERLGVVARHRLRVGEVPGSRAAERVVRSSFVSAALAGNGTNRAANVDLHRLRRTPVRRSDSAAVFAARARGGMRLEGSLRSTATVFRFRRSSV